MTSLADALTYAQKYGWPIFPVSTDGKKIPLIKKWPEAASNDPEIIKKWWRHWPQAFVGMPTGARSNRIVLDIDCKSGKPNGFWTLADNYCLYDPPDTPQVFTRSAGLHLHFAVNPDVAIRNSEGEHGLGPGLDVRGEGGFVVLPCDGSGYSWHSKLNPDTVEPLVAPAWFGHRTSATRARAETRRWFDPHTILTQACERIRTARDGDKHWQVNNNALRIGGLVRDGFLRRDEAWDDLQAATASLIRHSDADPKHTWKTLDKAFGDGLNAARRDRP